MPPVAAPVTAIKAAAYTIPTDSQEADGTLSWNKTTMIVVHVEAGGKTGLGYTYIDKSIVGLLQGILAEAIVGHDAMNIGDLHERMRRTVRNIGRSGLAATAISAVDIALWDVKAKLLGVSLSMLLGKRQDSVPVYDSGGFTSYDDARLRDQSSAWVECDGCRAVKMKVGRQPERDPHRVAVAKQAIGNADLFVDANGAYSVKDVAALAMVFADRADIRWFEEPLSSYNVAGLAALRPLLPPAVDQAAGEYIYTLDGARILLESGAVDVLQADASRCGGITGFLQVADLCDAFHTDLSGHCAPSLHLSVACAAPRLRHLEWFHDHVLIEQKLFDGAPVCLGGTIAPDDSRPGHGLVFKQADAEVFGG
jgi:L-alanine-DL-glutamate epimerase-like enolase superfamily enzyme